MCENGSRTTCSGFHRLHSESNLNILLLGVVGTSTRAVARAFASEPQPPVKSCSKKSSEVWICVARCPLHGSTLDLQVTTICCESAATLPHAAPCIIIVEDVPFTAKSSGPPSTHPPRAACAR